MDNHAFASLAHVRILLIPVGPIPQASFERYAAEIRSFESIRLGDIPADAKGEKARFMPSPLSTGHLHLSFPTHPPPSSHYPLSLLRPSHFPLAVIGIASCSQPDTLKAIYSQFTAALLDIFPASHTYPLAKNCFVFEELDNATNLNAGCDFPGLVVLPNMMGNKRLYIGTLLGDLCSQILGEFGALVQALETPLGNEYLNASLLPSLPPLSELPVPLDMNNAISSSSLPALNNQSDGSRSSFSLNAAPALKRNASLGPPIRHSTLIVPASKKRLSTIGTASSHARLYKVLGDFFLLAGRIEDASIWHTEAIQLFKNSQDHAWHASALEGLATIAIAEAWSTGHGLHSSTVASKEPWTDVIEKLTQASALYQKSPSYYEGDSNFALLSYLYSCCVLRRSTLLFAVWSAKGWGPLAFTTMLQPGPTPHLPPTLVHDDADPWMNLERLSRFSGISRSTISNSVSQIHGPWLLHLDPRERLSILEAMASIYACLGYKRKESYVLREVLGCIMDLMVCGREEDGITNVSSPQVTGLGILNGNMTPTTNAPGASIQGNVGIRVSESSSGNDSILKLLVYVCRTLGIDLEAVKLVDGSAQVNGQSEKTDTYEDSLSLESLETYGWPELQVGVIREAVAVAEALPDFPSVAQFSVSSLKTLQTVLSPADQHHLYSTSIRALSTARRRGDLRCLKYWSGRPVVSITLAPIPLIRLPVEKHISILQRHTSGPPPILKGITDPFLYNPRRAAAKKDYEIVAQNELLEFTVMLENPFVFDLEIQSIALSTSGVDFLSQPTRTVIPANSFHSVILSGNPVGTGILTVRGCLVQGPGGITHEFILPLRTDEEEERIARKKSALLCEIGRSKYSGLESFPWEKGEKATLYKSSQLKPGTDYRFLECKIIPEQPLLRIRRTSVNHGALMLYEGERSILRLTLENISPLPIDFIHLAFEDSTMEPAQQALGEGELSVFDTYETEYNLINKPVFSWDKEEAKTIQPGQALTLNISCLGKAGCTSGTVHVSYSYAHRTDLEEPSDYFYTRQVSYPIMVTVYPMLQCQNMDVMPFPSYHQYIHTLQNATSKYHLDIDEGTTWCLFSIEVRNMYGSPFEVVFDREQEGPPSATAATIIPPGSTSRIILPLKRITLSKEEVSKPIPTLSNRQFVVAKDKLSEAESRLQRELFWYREALFNSIKGHWKEVGGPRTGDVSLRQQRMTMHMLEAFRSDIAHVKFSLTTNGESVEAPLKPNVFLELKAKVTNLCPVSVPLVLSLDLEPSDCIVYEGTVRDIPLGRLDSGASRDISLPICFLTNGQFEFMAQVRLVGSQYVDMRPTKGQITTSVCD